MPGQHLPSWVRETEQMSGVLRGRGEDAVAPRSSSSGYDAFISYSHALDGRLAPAIRMGLHRFPRPWLRPRAARVFHDNASLSLSDNLWGLIETALRQSRCLILLASPEAAVSPWVNREVELWRAERSAYAIVLVLTSGEIVWRDGDFDRTRTNAVPAALQGHFAEEPLWLDLRWAHEADHLSMRDPRFRDAVATLAATIHGRPKDELIGADIRMGRRQLRLAIVALVALTALTLLAVTGGLVAYNQRNRAREQAQIALSRQLAAEAATLRTSDPATSLMLSVEALRTRPTAEAADGLTATLSETRYLGSVAERRSDQIERIRPSPRGDRWVTTRWGGVSGGQLDGERTEPACGLAELGGSARDVFYAPYAGLAAVQDRESGLALWDVADPCRPRPVVTVDPSDVGDPSPGLGSVVFSRERHLLFSTGSTELYDIATPKRPRRMSRLGGSMVDAAMSPDGRTLLTTDPTRNLTIWDLSNPSHPRPRSVLAGCERIEVAPDGHTVALIYRDAPATLWRLSHRRLSRLATLTTTNVAAFDVAFSGDGKSLVTGNYDSTATLWGVGNPRQPVQQATLGGHRQAVTAVAFTNDDRQVLTGDEGGRINRWSHLSGSQPGQVAFLRGYSGAPDLLGAGPAAAGGLLVVSDGTSAAPELWSTAGPSKPEKLSTLPRRGGSLLTLSVGRERVLTVDVDYQARLWDISDPRRPGYVGSAAAADGALSLDGTRLVTVDTSGLGHTWAVSTGEFRKVGTFGSGLVRTGRISPDGNTLAVVDDHGTELWDASNPRQPVRLATLDGRDVAWSPDGHILSVTGDESVHLVDVNDLRHPKILSTIDGVSEDTSFSPSGRLLAVGDANGVPTLWDVSRPAHPTRAARLVGHRGSVYHLVFSPDGSVLFTGSFDKTMGIWDVTPLEEQLGDPVARACAIAGPGMSVENWERYLTGSSYRPSCR